MSRGPGRIERAIHTLFDAHPGATFVTDEVCEYCYPGVTIEKKHQVAVLRAAWNGRLADKVRRLITENDPDAIRAGLAEIADVLHDRAAQ